MYKNKEKQREAVKKAVQKHRQGITIGEDVAQKVRVREIVSKGITQQGITYPDIIDKLTDESWRPRLEKICHAFKVSHHPDYSEMCWLGDNNLSVACDYLEATR